MAEQIGTAKAEEFATAHENDGPSSVPFDNQQDLHDNAVGRSLAAPGVDCSAACSGAVAFGVLRTVRGPVALTSARREGIALPPGFTAPAPCIGPSNQPWP
jgi:hypothetical protein